MKRTFEIENKPERIKEILSSFRNDKHLSKTFEGSTKNGLLTGFYTNLALINGVVIGYVKIRGQYDLDKGRLYFKIIPSYLYWFVIAFCLIATTVSVYESIHDDELVFIGSFLFLFIALLITVAYFLESRSFLKHFRRISNLTDNNKQIKKNI